MREIWKDVVGFEGKYKVSNRGRIYGILAKRVLKTCVSNTGYELVCLKDFNGNRKQHTVHRLVANAFIPNDRGLPVINHKDDNKLNNCADNLEWCTHRYNNTYNGAKERGTKTYEKRYCKPFYVYDKEMNLIGVFQNARKFAREHGIIGNCGNFGNALIKNSDGKGVYSCSGYIPSYVRLDVSSK